MLGSSPEDFHSAASQNLAVASKEKQRRYEHNKQDVFSCDVHSAHRATGFASSLFVPLGDPFVRQGPVLWHPKGMEGLGQRGACFVKVRHSTPVREFSVHSHLFSQLPRFRRSSLSVIWVPRPTDVGDESRSVWNRKDPSELLASHRASQVFGDPAPQLDPRRFQRVRVSGRFCKRFVQSGRSFHSTSLVPGAFDLDELLRSLFQCSNVKPHMSL